jgi:hypothetical protein
MMRQVGWYWRRGPQHYIKYVYLWLYDDAKANHVHDPLGFMCMNDYGDLVSCCPVLED